MGDNGVEWANNESKRSKDLIEAEYGIVVSGKEGLVWDTWDTEHNEVWIDKEKVLEQGHPWDFCPVSIEVVSLGYGAMLLDDDSVLYEGESIFFLIRELVPELNRVGVLER